MKNCYEYNDCNYYTCCNSFLYMGLEDKISNGHDNPFILELSNSTKCLVWMHECGAANGDEVLSEACEDFNAVVSESIYDEVKKKIRMYHI